MALTANSAAAATCAPIGYRQLIEEGQQAGPGLPFMALYSSDGKGILRADKSIETSPYPDAVTLHSVGSKIAMVSHTEFPQPGGMWVSTVERNSGTGALSVSHASRIGLAGVNGVGAMCAGSVFGKYHLGGEEYPNDCRSSSGAAASAETARFYGYYSGDAAKSLPNPPNKGDYAVKENAAAVAKLYSCYNMGAIVQVEPYKSSSNGQLDGRITKLRTMGRFSHETAVVAPDRKTVMLTADDKMGVFAMFVADKAGDLRSGTLYAAKFTNQQGPEDPVSGLGASWDVEWIELGKGKQVLLDQKASNPATKFSAIFDAVEPDLATLLCPEGYKQANTYGYKKTQTGTGVQRYMECLKTQPGQETVAAFLETQRYASIMGATTEFEKLEGVDFSKELKRWYIAISNVDRAMLDGSTNNYYYDIPGNDGIRLPKNKCGVIIELSDFPTSGKGAWQPTKARVIIAGSDKTGTDADNACDVNGIASPDNVFVIPGTSTLLIAEDTDHHANNVLWAADVSDTSSPPALTRVLSAPLGAEITGLSSATFGQHSYIPMAFQHPNVGKASIGYLGPFPKKSFLPFANGKPRAVSFDGVGLQTGGADENAVVGPAQVCY
jgi:secreted PhoX family phosphatase